MFLLTFLLCLHYRLVDIRLCRDATGNLPAVQGVIPGRAGITKSRLFFLL